MRERITLLIPVYEVFLLVRRRVIHARYPELIEAQHQADRQRLEVFNRRLDPIPFVEHLLDNIFYQDDKSEYKAREWLKNQKLPGDIVQSIINDAFGLLYEDVMGLVEPFRVHYRQISWAIRDEDTASFTLSSPIDPEEPVFLVGHTEP